MEYPVPGPIPPTLPYAALLTGSLQGVLIAGEGRVVLANESAAALFGAAGPAALQGRPLTRLLGAEGVQRLEAARQGSSRGKPARCTLRVQSPLGRPLSLEVAALPVPWEGGEAVQLTFLDRTELEAARTALAERDAAFRDIIEGSLQGIYVHADHRFLFVNQAFADIFGYADPDELLAMGDVLQVYAPSERERLTGYYHERIGGGAPPVRYEFQGLRKDGRPIWLENLVRRVTWQGREANLVTVVDISETKRVVEELRASEEKYRDVVEGSMQGILVQRQSRALFANQAFAETFGYETPEQILALDSLLELVAEDDRDMMVRNARARMHGEPAPDHYVGHGRRRDGSDAWLDTTVRVVNWEGTKALQVAVIDVTERVRAERELEAQRRLLRAVLDTIPHSVYVKDRDLRYQMANRAFGTYFGLTPDEVVGRCLDEIGTDDPEAMARVRAMDAAIFETGQPQELYDVAVRLTDGRVARRHLIKYPLCDERGTVVSVVGITEDISERVAAEERVRANERLMRMVFDRLPFRVFVKDLEGRYQLVNTAFADFHRLTPEQIVGRTAEELPMGSPNDLAIFRETDRQVLESGQPLDVQEQSLTPVNGTPRVNHMQKLPLRDDSGAIVGVVGLSEDITERIESQEALRASQRLLHTVVDTIPHAIFVKGVDGRFQMVNRAYAEFYSLTPDHFVGMHHNDLPQRVEPSEEIYDETDRELLATGNLVEIPEVVLIRPDHPPCIRSVIKMPLRDGAGRIVGIVGVSEDITERRRADEALRSSQRLLRAVIDTIPLGIYVKDRECRYQVANEATGRHYGRPVEDVLGHTLRELEPVWTPALAQMDAADREVLRTGTPFDLPDLPAPDEQGRERIWHIFKIPMLDEQGRTTGVVGVSEDITERKRVEEELRSNRMLLQTVFNLLPLWVFVKDSQRRFLMVNRQMAEDYAVHPEVGRGELIDLGATITEEEKSVIYELDQRVLDTGELVEVPEVQLTLPRKGARLFRTVRMPLRDAQGAVEGIVGIAEDITERHRTEQAIQQAQKLESLGVLAGGIAHDFNNLLVSILGNASLALLDLPGDAPAHEPICQIETAGQRAADLCRQMLAYSGKGSFEIASVSLNALIREMTQLLHVSLARTITLRYEFDPELPAVEVDPTQIRQVVMNLVMNAAEAIGARPGSIAVSTAVVHADREMLREYIQGDRLPEGDYVRLEVTDTGDGIAPEMLSRIFDPFFTTKFTGRGLGLAAVLGIVRGHHGAMQVASAPGQGSTFRLLLPAQGGPAAPAPQAPASKPWRGQGTVLVVDDEDEVRSVLERMLASLGFVVLTATDGTEAVARLQEGAAEIRLVMLDLTMPGLSGEQTLRRLRELRTGLPALVISGYAEGDVRERFGDTPVEAVLRKPFTLQALSETLQRLLG